MGQGRQSARLRSVIAPAAVLLSACYVYVPVDLGSPDPPLGEQVRVYVQTDAAQRFSAQAGRSVRELEGRLLATSRDSIRVSVVVAPRPRGLPAEPIRQVFSAATSEVLEVRRAELSRRRTILLGAGIVAVLAFAILRVSAPEGGGTPAPPPSFPEAPALIPDPAIFR